MKKVISGFLVTTLLVSVFGMFDISYAETSNKAEVYTEIYSADFDKLETTELTQDQTALKATYPNTQLVSDTTNWNYKIEEKTAGDKALYIAQTTTSTTGSGGHTGVMITVPDGGLKNTEKYKISYDVKWPTLTKNGPYVRTKTLHYTSNKYDNFGPVLNAMGPQAADDSVKMFGSYSTQDHTSKGNDDSWFVASTATDKQAELATGVWHKVDIIIDCLDSNNKKIDYYYDGKYTGTQSGATFPNWAVNPGIELEILVFQGFQQWEGAYLDNISIAKSTKASTGFEADAIIVSDNKKEIRIYKDGISKVQSASVVNNTSGEIITAEVKNMVGGVKLCVENELDDNTEYVVNLETADGTVNGKITLGSADGENKSEKWLDLFCYDFSDGKVPSQFETGETGVSVENNALKLSGNGDISFDIPLAAAGNNNVADTTIFSNSGVYELSFDIKVKKSGSYAPLFKLVTLNYKDNIESIPLFVHQWNGKLGSPKQSSAWYDNYTSLAELSDDEWYNIKMVMNTDDGSIKYYGNNTLLFERAQVLWWKNSSEYYDITEGIDCLRIAQGGTAVSGEKTSYIDNIKLRKNITKTELFSYSFNGDELPAQLNVNSGSFSIDENALKIVSGAGMKIDLAKAGNVEKNNVSIPANSGIYELKFDIKTAKNASNNAPWFRLSAENNGKKIQAVQFFVHQWNSNFAAPKQSYAWYDNYNTLKTPENNKWYSVKMVMNTYDGTVAYYDGTKLLGKYDKVLWWSGDNSYNFSEGIDAFYILHSANGDMNTTYIDNLSLSRVDVNVTGVDVTDAYGSKLVMAKTYDRAIKAINVSVDGIVSESELSSVTLEKDGTAVAVDAVYNAETQSITVTPDDTLMQGTYKLTALGSEYRFGVEFPENAEISSFTLVDENGGDIADGDTVTAAATVRNNLKDAALIIAIYNDDVLTNLEIENFKKERVTETVSKSLAVKNSENVLVRAYIWSNMNSIIPIANEALSLYN